MPIRRRINEIGGFKNINLLINEENMPITNADLYTAIKNISKSISLQNLKQF